MCRIATNKIQVEFNYPRILHLGIRLNSKTGTEGDWNYLQSPPEVLLSTRLGNGSLADKKAPSVNKGETLKYNEK